MKVAVCGFRGTTGSAVARLLVESGISVRGLVRRGSGDRRHGVTMEARSALGHGSRPSSGSGSHPGPGPGPGSSHGRASVPGPGPGPGVDPHTGIDRTRIEEVEVDFKDSASLTTAFDGVDAAYLMVPASPDMETLGLCLNEAAERSRLRHVVRLSILGTLIDRGTGLGEAHGRVDRDLADRAVRSTILRPNGFMQNYLSMADSIGAGAMYTSNGDGCAAIVDVEDIARAVVAVLGQGTVGIHDLTGPEALTNAQAADTLASILGWPVAAVSVPNEVAAGAMRSAGLPAWLVDRLMEIQIATAAGMGAQVTGAIAELTGRPPTGFADFVERNRPQFQKARRAGATD